LKELFFEPLADKDIALYSVEYPPQLAGSPLHEALKKFRGAPIKTEKDGKIHVFVVRHSAYLKKMLLPAPGLKVEVRTPSLSAPLP